MSAAPDFVTVLRACEGRLLAKRVTELTPAGIKAHDGATFFDVVVKRIPAEVDCLDWWMRNLPILARQSLACIIRGRFIGTIPRTVRRRASTWDDYPAQFEAAPHRWVALDVDSVPFPTGVAAEDVAACGVVARAVLPPAFQGIRTLVQATSGHGIKPTIRVRLIFGLSRPVSDAELKVWLGGYPVDDSLFNPVQPCYTATPIFHAGLVDPIPHRFAELTGHAVVEVPSPEELAPQQREARPLSEFSCAEAASPYVRQELTRAIGQIRGAGDGERHRTVVREATRTAKLVKAGWLAEAGWRSAIHAATLDVAPHAEFHNIERILDWAVDQAPTPGEEFFS